MVHIQKNHNTGTYDVRDEKNQLATGVTFENYNEKLKTPSSRKAFANYMRGVEQMERVK